MLLVKQMSEITTNHHQYLVAQYFEDENSDDLKQKIIEIEVTDEDELAITIDGKVFYISIALLKTSLENSGVLD